jgi:urease subunit alpha
MDSEEYLNHFGPTVGDRFRLGDTGLLAEVEEDHITYGDESVVGGGKVVRDGLGHASGSAHGNVVDWVLTNATIVDPVLGIVKADIGIKDGWIVGIGNSGNPETMSFVDSDLVIGGNTEPFDCKGMIVTPGGLDIHLHFFSADLPRHAISSGITTMLGGGTGPVFPIATTGPENLKMMHKAGEEWPINFGFYGNASAHEPETIEEQTRAGACGFKIHEDWGAMPETIDTALEVGDEHDVQIIVHTDTLNESGYFEDTFDAIGGRNIHLFHIEGAGGGHAPDLLEGVGHENVLPSSTNPTNPYTTNTADEHLDMIMTVHHLDPDSPEDVAFADSRIRPETIAAEDVLHDMGAISMMTSDSMGMGRAAEVISRTWQTAHHMKQQRGPLPEDEGTENDNQRIKRYIAKYTINPAITAGIDDYVGSLEPGKLADIVLWDPAFFGLKPELVFKGGFPTWANTGEANAASMWAEPMMQRPMYGAKGEAPKANSIHFASEAAVENDIQEKIGLDTPIVPVHGIRGLTKSDMVRNDYCPSDIDVDAETFEVTIDGEPVTCEPTDSVPLAQRYLL